MSTTSGEADQPGREVTLRQLSALNEELAWLVRAGLPLTMLLAPDRSGRGRNLDGLTERLARRMGQGMSLVEAVRAEGDVLPPIYRAVVEAGLRSGRLATALERLADAAQSADQLRRWATTAFIYPTAVLAVAYVLFIALCYYLVPQLAATYVAFRSEPSGWLAGLLWFNSWLPLCGPLVPLMVVGFWFWWSRTTRASSTGNGRGFLFAVRMLPGMSDQLQAGFAELLALLVEHDTPLPDALELAGAAAGNPRLAEETQTIAASIRSGRSLDQAVEQTQALPSIARELLVSTAADQAALAGGLYEAARIYRERAFRKAMRFKSLVPLVAVVLVAGTAVLVYAVSVFGPLAELWRNFVAASQV